MPGLPNWRQGAPWWAVPFLLVGYIAAALGLLVALLDWWTVGILILVAFVVWAAITGQWFFAVFCLLGATAGVLGLRAEARADRRSRQ